MIRVVLAHAPGDEPAAERVCAVLTGVDTLRMPVGPKTRALQYGPNVVLAVLWSERAAACVSAPLLAKFAAGVRSAFLICTDATPPNEALTALRLISTPFNATADDISAALRGARLTAAHRQTQAPTRERTPELGAARAPGSGETSYARMFMSGLARGFASSLALVGIGGGLTIGIQESAGLVGASSDASAAERPAPEALSAALRANGIVSDEQVLAEAAALRAAEAADRPHIGEVLTMTDQRLADARERTARILSRLKALADAPDMSIALPQLTLRGTSRFDADSQQELASAPDGAPRRA